MNPRTPPGIYACIHPAVPTDIQQGAQRREVACKNGHITGHWDGQRRAYAVEGRQMPVVSGNASGEGPFKAPGKLWHHLTCLDVAIQTAHSFFSFPRSKRGQKYNSEEKLAGQTALTFLFGILRVNYSSPSATNVGSNPKSPGEEFKQPRNTGSISEHLR